MVDTAVNAVVLGIGATLFMDICAWVQNRFFGVSSLDYALVGRWLLALRKGKYFHKPIFKSPKAHGEVVIGWGAHYLIGIVFAAALLLAFPDWLRLPSLVVALSVGVISVLAPFLILQPAFGLGIAAEKTPNPSVVRAKSMLAHITYGVGLYLSGISITLWL